MQALTINNLTKTYPRGLTAVNNISFKVDDGDFFALLGPNGAGKSTTIGIISGLVNKSSGQVKVYDHDIDTDFPGAKSCLGLMPQEFNFNIFEKVIQIVVNQAGYYGIPRRIAYDRAEKYLTKLGIWDKRDAPARTLSGGMKRRLMIARALVHEPKLLILDEPTAGVDIELRRSLWDFLREINKQGITIILTTHYLEEAENLCKNIAIIDEGKIIENTSMKSLLQTLQRETFILYLKQHITQSPQVKDFAIQMIDESTLEVDIYQDQSLNELFRQLSAQSLDVISMRNKANRLEELFIRLVKGNKEEE